MYLAISTGVQYKKHVCRVLPDIAEAGFRYVELLASKGHWDTENPDEVEAVSALMKKLDLKAVSVHAPFYGFDTSSIDEGLRHASVQAILSAAQAAAKVDANILTAHFGGESITGVPEMRRINQASKSIAEVLGKMPDRVMLAAETLLPHLAVGHPLSLFLLLRNFRDCIRMSADRRRLGICFDTSHALFSGRPTEYLVLVAEHVVAVHASDNMGKRDDHALPFTGKVPWAEIIPVLNSVNFSGPLVLELVGPGRRRELGDYLKSALERGTRLINREFEH